MTSITRKATDAEKSTIAKSSDNVTVNLSIDCVIEERGDWPFKQKFRKYEIRVQDFGVNQVASTIVQSLEQSFKGITNTRSETEWSAIAFESLVKRNSEMEPETVSRHVFGRIGEMKLEPLVYPQDTERVQEGIFSTDDGLEFKGKFCTKNPISSSLRTILTQQVQQRGDEVDSFLLRKLKGIDPSLDCFSEYREFAESKGEPSKSFSHRIELIREAIETLNFAKQKTEEQALLSEIKSLESECSFVTRTGVDYKVELSVGYSPIIKTFPETLTIRIPFRNDMLDTIVSKKVARFSPQKTGRVLSFTTKTQPVEMSRFFHALQDAIQRINQFDVETERNSLQRQLESLQGKLDELDNRVTTIRERISHLQRELERAKHQSFTKYQVDAIEHALAEAEQLLFTTEREVQQQRGEILRQMREIERMMGRVNSNNPFSEFVGGGSWWDDVEASRFLDIIYSLYGQRINASLGDNRSDLPEGLLEGRQLKRDSPVRMSGTKIVRTTIIEFGIEKKGGIIEISIVCGGANRYRASINREEAASSQHVVDRAIQALEGVVRSEIYNQHRD